MSTKVAIIGGSGFIGSFLCKRLEKNKKVDFYILDKRKSNHFPERWHYCDVTDKDSLRSSLKGCDLIVNLAAEHKDNVQPKSLYYDVNVEGQKNICEIADELSISRQIFTSSVAVYGFVEVDTDESGKFNPFNDYGVSKLQAENVLNQWYDDTKQLSVIRPTVVFGQGNRGNVYNLLRQIASGRFLMVGGGKNKKSMAYVENVAAIIDYLIVNGNRHQVFNYADKPDFDMNTLCRVVYDAIGKKNKMLKVPFIIGYIGGAFFDFLSWITRKEYPVSRIRIKKFCATTQFRSSKIESLEFNPPFTLSEGIQKTVNSEFKK